MMKNIMKKLFIIFFMMFFLFSFSTYISDHEHVIATDYQNTSSWDGQDLQVAPQQRVIFDSKYVYFSEIADDPGAVNSEKTYVIQSAYDLYKLSEQSMGANKSIYLGLDYVLGNDIDYYEIVKQNTERRFHPIGITEPFTGTFDGQGFEISNLYFDSIMTEEDYDLNYPDLRYLSMFSRVGTTGYIHDLGLVNPIFIQPIEWGIMSYVSALAGENYGTINNTYLLDERDATSGFNAEGAFHLSGLVSINYGTLSNSFVAARHIKALSVRENLSTSAVLYQNQGTISHVYYDEDLYSDIGALTSNSIGLTQLAFQNTAIFDQGWFFNNAYQGAASNNAEYDQLTLHHTYPILQGLNVSNGALMIEDAMDLLYMNELLMISGAFRNATYQLNHDIDMNQVAEDAYRSAEVGFNGIFESSIFIEAYTLYNHEINQGGELTNYSIINLRLSNPTYLGDYAGYGLFASLFGIVQHVNFINLALNPLMFDDAVNRSQVLIGSIASQMNHGTIKHVHVDQDITMTNQVRLSSQLFIGGLVGKGSGIIEYSTTHGLMESGSYLYDQAADGSAAGGIIGYSDSIIVNNSINDLDVTGIGYIDSEFTTGYLGGIVGFGTVETLSRVVNQGLVSASTDYAYNSSIYMGGIVGKIDLEHELSYILNEGSVVANMNQSMTMNIAGFGTVNQASDTVIMRSITNNGELSISKPIGFEPTAAQIQQTHVQVSGVLIADDVSGTIEGLFNQKNLVFDLELIEKISGNIISLGSQRLNVVQSYNTGDILLESKHMLEQEEIWISGNIIGSNISSSHIRNEGNITVNINHASDSIIDSGDLYVNGLMTEVSQGNTAENGFNGGQIVIQSLDTQELNYNVYASGIIYHNANTDLYQTSGLNPDSIEVKGEKGSVDHMLNQGNILIRGMFQGDMIASGISTINTSLMTEVINLGNIEVHRTGGQAENETSASGLVYLMDSEYSRIQDSANDGSIKALSLASSGYVHAAGIAIRNDLLPDGTPVTPGTLNQLAKIWFTINYGDVYAYQLLDESFISITDQAHTIAASFLAVGLMSLINDVNYGNIFSRYMASGMIGLLNFNAFGTIANDQVYIANSINYGKIRWISDYIEVDDTFVLDIEQTPPASSYQAFGAIVAKIHTGTDTWAFAGDVTYPIDRIYFGYLINFDDRINMFALAPDLSTTWADAFGNLQSANDAILNMIQYMATTNSNDQSAEPFTYFYSGGWIGQYMGAKIQYYDVSDTDTGMFYEQFAFRSSRPVYTGTDQYIRNFIDYIPLDKANPVLVNHIEASTSFSYPGIYALSSSEGIGNGIFIPDNFSLDELNPHQMNEIEPDTTWIGSDTDLNSIAYKLYVEMRQIKSDFATTIYDMELKQVDDNGNYVNDGMILSAPIIDDERALITYYLPSNALALSGNSSSLMDVYRFVEVSEGLGNMVPDLIASGEQTYSWVGDYKKSGSDFVEIGPYDTSGIYNPTTTDTQPYLSTSRNVPVYDQTSMDANSTMPFLYVHHPHIKFLIWWTASGYRLDPGQTQSPGYGAYAPYVLDGYPTLYRYVGPSKEPVTYIRTDVTHDITVFDQSTLRFKVNDETGSYILSQNAGIEYQGTSMMTSVSVPRSYGIYDSMYDASNQYIDGVADHYGSIRIYSASYNPEDPSTYKDYNIRIIRTADQHLTNIDALTVNGLDALGSFSDFHDVTATQNLSYHEVGELGVLNVSYETENIADQSNLLPYLTLYDELGQEVDPSLYDLQQGLVSNEHTLNNQDGTFGTGVVTIAFHITSDLPSGSYTLRLTLITGETVEVNVIKDQSSDASILSLEFDHKPVELINDTYSSWIPYGIYFDASDPTTSIVDFSNLSQMNERYYTDLANGDIPNYLTNLVIAPFATLVSTDLSIEILSSSQHVYHISYVIRAEDGTEATYQHLLYEQLINPDAIKIYQNGGEIDTNQSPIEIGFLDAPTMRVTYDFSNIWFKTLTTNLNFIPAEDTGQVMEYEDYYITDIPEIGYEVEFNQNIPLGIYELSSSYDFSIDLWGTTLSWHYDFEQVLLEKIKNDDSLIQDIMFVSDTIYAGFDTIVDTTPITVESYLNYMLYPETRTINVLPTSGIYYGSYDDLSIYWIVGQVQKTSLNYYLPSFVLPYGSQMVRVIDDAHISYDYQSADLSADYSPIGDGFNFIHYRVYAHDFDENPTHYTDYMIAVQDVTNNIKFNLTVINNSSQPLDDVVVSINVCQVGETYASECPLSEAWLSMTTIAVYDPEQDIYKSNPFQTATYGTYQMYVELPDDLSYVLTLESEPVIGSSFYLENSIMPRKYHITLTIIDDSDTATWGYEKTWINIEGVSDLDDTKTYESGMYFIYDSVLYMVQDSFVYQFDSNHLPGSSPELGLLRVCSVFDHNSTYVVGDIVYFKGSYFKSLRLNLLGVYPDEAGMSDGYWTQLP